MGNKNTTPFQPLINTPTGIVCPICFKICKRFEKLHPTNGDQDHFVCFSCYRELIANKRNTHCPLCKTKMYPFPIVFYYQCDLCYRIKTQLSLNHFNFYRTLTIVSVIFAFQIVRHVLYATKLFSLSKIPKNSRFSDKFFFLSEQYKTTKNWC